MDAVTLAVIVTCNEDGTFTGAVATPGDNFIDGITDEPMAVVVAEELSTIVKDAIIDALTEPMEFKRADS